MYRDSTTTYKIHYEHLYEHLHDHLCDHMYEHFCEHLAEERKRLCGAPMLAQVQLFDAQQPPRLKDVFAKMSVKVLVKVSVCYNNKSMYIGNYTMYTILYILYICIFYIFIYLVYFIYVVCFICIPSEQKHMYIYIYIYIFIYV